MKFLIIPIVLALGICLGCDDQPSSDQIQRAQQEKILQEGTAQTGMPAVKNWRERKMLKEIIELRDQEGLITYTYTYSEYTGKFHYLGQTIGYGIPYATQYTNPAKPVSPGAAHEYIAIPQADPNGLFSPASAEGTWILMKDPNSDKVSPIYVEPRILVSPFKLPNSVLDN